MPHNQRSLLFHEQALQLKTYSHFHYRIRCYRWYCRKQLQFFFEDNADNSFNVYLLDEKNRLEIYRQCEGSKDDKVREINRIYQSLGSNDCENPYKMVQRNFNYPQFYQLHSTESGMRIMPFKFKSKRTCE